MINQMYTARRRCIHRILSLMASVVLLLVPVFFYLLMHSDTPRTPSYFISLTSAIICTSVRWWPSFFQITEGRTSDDHPQTETLNEVWYHDRVKFIRHCHCIVTHWKKVKWYLSDIVKDLERCRLPLYTYISLVQILIYALFSNFLLPSPLLINGPMYKEAFAQIQIMYSEFWWLSVGIAGAYLAYLAGKTMCKVNF